MVATPIGDADDISLRALKVLQAADRVAAEDTRVARELLRSLNIDKPVMSCWDGNEAQRVPELLSRLAAGEHIALVSDAGSPLVSDPGFRVVRACVEAGVRINVVPGACAAIAGLMGAGLPSDRFLFVGFPPHTRSEKLRFLEELGGERGTLILYESPLRLAETLDLIAGLWPERPVVLARNLTARFEQWIRGTAAAVRAELADETRGQATLLIGGATGGAAQGWALAESLMTKLLSEGRAPREVRDIVAEATGLPKREIYQRILQSSAQRSE